MPLFAIHRRGEVSRESAPFPDKVRSWQITYRGNGVPLVSIVVSVYNGRPFLAEAIQSILDQSFRDFELIIVDDGSTDDSQKIVAGFSDARMRLLINKQNLGLARSLNNGIAVANGEYIARQDADDVSLPDRLQTQIEYLRSHAEVVIVGSSVKTINKCGKEDGVWPALKSDIAIKWRLLFGTAFIHSSVVMRRSALDRVGLYSVEPQFCYVEDYELWSRICASGRCANISFPLVKYRVNSDSICNRYAVQQRLQIEKVSRRAMEWILGSSTWSPDFWPVIQKFLFTKASEPVNFETSEISLAISALEDLYGAFSRTYEFPHCEQHRDRKQNLLLWGKHCLALAYKQNGERSLRCRAALVASGAALLSKGTLQSIS
jgi:glycosyltransferase involved in cell wall biosynthesis